MKKKIITNKRDVFVSIFKFFVLIQFSALLLEIILPIDSIYGQGKERFLINTVFYFVVIIVSLVVSSAKRKGYTHYKRSNFITIKKLYFLLKISSKLGFFGMIFILFDRVVFKKIDYSLGLRHARYQWINAVSPSIYSKILSILGNVMVPMAFITVILLYLYWEDIDKKIRIKRLMLSTAAVFVFAAMNGSRSIVFIQVFLLLCTSLLRCVKGKKIVPITNRKKTDKKFFVFFIFAISYVLTIFKSSTKLGKINSRTLFEIFILDLGGKIKEGYYLFFTKNFSDDSIIYHFFSAITYLIHSQWTFEGILLLAKREGKVFSYSLMYFLYRMGILSTEPQAYHFYGLFVSLPGAIVYDFGIIGMIIFGFIYGAILGAVIIRIERPQKSGGFDFAIIMFGLSSIFIAPFTAVHNFIYFDFVIIDMILLECITRIFNKKSSWIYLENEVYENNRIGDEK